MKTNNTVKIIAKGFATTRTIEVIEKAHLAVNRNQQRLHTLAKSDETLWVATIDGELLYPLAKY